MDRSYPHPTTESLVPFDVNAAHNEIQQQLISSLDMLNAIVAYLMGESPKEEEKLYPSSSFINRMNEQAALAAEVNNKVRRINRFFLGEGPSSGIKQAR